MIIGARNYFIILIKRCYFGTNYKTVSNWKSVPKIASEIIEKMETFQYKIKILNLGDGFDFVDQENEIHDWIKFQEDLGSLNNGLSEYFPDKREISVIAQPGRYFVQKSELFAFKVIQHIFFAIHQPF